MLFHVLTLFPEFILDMTRHSVTGRAVKNGLIAVNVVNIRDFAVNSYGQADDAPYGGGAGMVMMAPPVCDAYASLNTAARVIYLTPQGRPFNQKKAEALARESEIVLLCGHYEGVDERALEELNAEELSVGDYILTGGEPAALVLIDAVARLIPGVLGKEASHMDESFSNGGLLEYPQYTRPPVYRGRGVPPVLLSGHHRRIAEWRRERSKERTLRKRPELYFSEIYFNKGEEHMVLSGYEPKSVLKFFEAISQIPRGSGNEKAVSDYITSFARDKGLRVVQDEKLNVIIFKPGTPGYEDHAPIILQGHMDMVCEKNKDTVHDFLKDPLKLRVEGDMLYATGTTLGADNGVAVAMCLALADADDVPHPPLEIILTVDEETGMTGAEFLDASLFSAKRMINMDTGCEGVLFTGCAGGVNVRFAVPAEWETADADANHYILEVKGLKGGHSGAEIHNERADSIVVLARALAALDGTDYRVAYLSGGMKINAIPREAEAGVVIKRADAQKAEAAVSALLSDLKSEYRVSDPNLSLTLRAAKNPVSAVLTRECSGKAVNALLLLPYGVRAMSMDIPGMVETSCNVGVLETTENEIIVRLMPRSSVASRTALVKRQINAVAALAGAKAEFAHEYSGWAYNPDSALRHSAVELYKRMYNKEPVVTAVHAGLECGILLGKMPELDIISFGPDTWDVHTPDEHMSLSSTARGYAFLCELLKNL